MNSEENADGGIYIQEKIEEVFGGRVSFPLLQAHRLGYQYRRVDIVDEAREQEHGAENKEIDIGFDIAAEIPGDDDGHHKENALGKNVE